MQHFPSVNPLRSLTIGFLSLVAAVNAQTNSNVTLATDANGGWILQKDGSSFLSLGVNYINFAEYWPSGTTVYDAQKAKGFYTVQSQYSFPYLDWSTATETRLRSWGFNTAGPYSHEALYDRPLYHTRVLPGGPNGATHPLVDVFDRNFKVNLEAAAAPMLQTHAGDSWLIGYFLGNELNWFGTSKWSSSETDSLMIVYNSLPASAPGKVALIQYFKDSFNSWDDFRANIATTATSWSSLQEGAPIKVWSFKAQEVEKEWAGRVADLYFKAYAEIIRRLSPGHLLLGSRFVPHTPIPVLKAAAKYNDILSFNYYTVTTSPALETWRSIFSATGRPILISEFSFRSNDNRSGNPNTVGADCTVPNQAERANRTLSIVTAWLNEPYIIGAHWFQYFDQPPGGKFSNNENSNYGLVDIFDAPYEALVNSWKTIGQQFAIGRKAPQSMPEVTPVSAPTSLVVTVTVDRLISKVTPALASPPSGFYASMDSASGARSTISTRTNGVIWTISTGSGWGAHLVFTGPRLRALPDAGLIRLGVTAPVGFNFRVGFTESGSGPTGSSSFVGVNGCDGERYMSPTYRGTGARQEVVLSLNNLIVDRTWGNQKGDKHLELAGLEHLMIMVPSNQGDAIVTVDNVEWLPAGSGFIASPAVF